jgi:ribose 1,5-bisphosphate isomerase
MLFDRIVKDIKALKIQGAQAVAKQSLVALVDRARRSRAPSFPILMDELLAARQALETTRPTEPCMRNALRFALDGVQSGEVKDAKAQVLRNVEEAQRHFAEAERRIADYGAKKVLRGMAIYTHCHSSTVVRILETARRQGTDFTVRNTETRPSFQGRITAAQLAAVGVTVEHYADSAARYALRKADLVLLGADAITSEGAIINKVGTHIMVDLARRHEIPVYFCADSWKFDPLTVEGAWETLETRASKEVWPRPPKGVMVRNPVFESVDPDMATGIISELGVFKPEVFIEEVKDAYPWMFTSP